ncbi:MAG: hypothetical protein MI724_10635 [Spirochaetales bacterium]|nr:hypothetical protein [Spirochaetales bacterium]
MKMSLASIGFLLVLVSCNAYLPHLQVVRANYNVSRGEYQPAIVDYLRAQETAQFEDWLSYNLGNVYHFLGESEAADDRWESARTSNVTDLLFGASFNQGVYLYEQGRYEEALTEFRFALSVEPQSVAAKNNFELTLEKIEAGSELAGRGSVSAGGGSSSSEDGTGATRMLDYMRRKEEQRWRANVEVGVSPAAEDW